MATQTLAELYLGLSGGAMDAIVAAAVRSGADQATIDKLTGALTRDAAGRRAEAQTEAIINFERQLRALVLSLDNETRDAVFACETGAPGRSYSVSLAGSDLAPAVKNRNDRDSLATIVSTDTAV